MLSPIEYSEGYKAGSDGISIEDCPYTENEDSMLLWLLGYSHARQDIVDNELKDESNEEL